jgi:hypothetical protein
VASEWGGRASGVGDPVPERMKGPWIDRRLQEVPPRPWRKVHLDYHNSHHMPSLGGEFDADEFGERLLGAHVDSIVVFAKDMHGYFYYPSEYGPVHPGLSFDMLGQQVEACRRRGIKVYAYYCVTWDNYLAENHPEWLVWKRDRTTYLPKFDETPRWTALCLSNPDFVEVVLDHSREIVAGYDLDGIWYDMPLPIGGECYCRNCLPAIRAAGRDPFDVAAQREHKQALLTEFMRRAYEQARSIRPGCQVDQNNQTRLGLGERAPYMDNIDIEALPTAAWGYTYYPAVVRYARTFGTSVCGMTGRFHRSWADFGGLKHPTQLRAELAGIVAQGAQADIGDQLPPSGKLDVAVYDVIGKAYAEVKKLEPFLDGAAPVTEAAIVVAGLPLHDFGLTSGGEGGPGECGGTGDLSRGVLGCTKLLTEMRVQFDIVEPGSENGDILNRYRLLVLPDGLTVDEELAEQLRSYLRDGGAVFASHDALRIGGTGEVWADGLGIEYQGESPFAPSYLKMGPDLLDGLPDYEYALYEGTARWTCSGGEQMLARVSEPLFQRGPEHYTSHAQTPADHVTEYAAVVRQGRVAATAFPIGASYYRNGYWIYREVFRRLLEQILPERLVRTDAPISAEVTLTHQRATGERPARYMVHVVNFSPNRRTPEQTEYLEDPIPMRDVQVNLSLNTGIVRAYLAGGGEVPLKSTGEGYRIEVPKVETGAIVVLEEAGE